MEVCLSLSGDGCDDLDEGDDSWADCLYLATLGMLKACNDLKERIA